MADFDEALDRIGLLMDLLEDYQEGLLEQIRTGRDDPLSWAGESAETLSSRRHLPERVVSTLKSALDSRSSAHALQLAQSSPDVIMDWRDLYLSHERLFGHLVLRHAYACDPHSSNEELLIAHSRLHRPSS